MGTRVFVGGLTYRIRERDLEKFFRKYGRIREVSMKNGFAFVEFDDYRDADDAVYELNGRELLGERVVVEHARGTARRDRGYGGGGAGFGRRSSWMDKDVDARMNDRYGPPTRTEYRLVVENLSSRVSWQDLKDFMRQAGEVTYADAHKQRRNEGVVEFATHSDMKNAIDKLDDADLNGRRIRLVDDSRRGGRRRTRSSSSRSRSRSRSRRRSRTRSRSRSGSQRSRSRSRRSGRSKSKSRGRSKSASRSKSRSRSKSPSRSKSKSRERSKSKSGSRSRSRSRSEPKKRSKSRSLSKSKAQSKDRSRSRSRSASKGHSKSKSRSRSKSADKDQDRSPQKKDD